MRYVDKTTGQLVTITTDYKKKFTTRDYCGDPYNETELNSNLTQIRILKMKGVSGYRLLMITLQQSHCCSDISDRRSFDDSGPSSVRWCSFTSFDYVVAFQ
jgi:hypothetical protein